MLPAAARVHTRRDHLTVAREGRRARRGSVLVQVANAGKDAGHARGTVIAGRRVGPSVVRNRVKRRLREGLRAELVGVPDGSLVIVRALAGSADALPADLHRWLRAGLAATVPSAATESATGHRSESHRSDG